MVATASKILLHTHLHNTNNIRFCAEIFHYSEQALHTRRAAFTPESDTHAS